VNSKPITQKTITIGNNANTEYIVQDDNIAQPKPIKIFNKMCPDIIFANSLIAKLKIFDT
jgi:hypothetical protein